MKNTPEQLAKMIIDSGMAKQSDIHGLSEQQISQIQDLHKVSLPGAYKHFLRTMGNSSDSVFYSVSFVFPALEERRSWAYKLASQASLQLPSTAFVFLIDDALFFFFDTKEGDDPPVYRFIEGQQVNKIANSFSQWLNDYVSTEVELDMQNKMSSRNK